VLKVEHRLYPAAAAHLCSAILEGRDPGPLDFGVEAFSLGDDPGF
jgi:hypothetical protein